MTSHRNIVVQTHQLTKHYRHPLFTWVIRARALTDLTLEIKQGTVYGILGPNGSGKSTTIKLILGLIFPTQGHVAVFGKRPNDRVIKNYVGYLPEESYLYPFLNAEETLDFYGRLFRLPRRERKRRIEALLDLVGLRKERQRPIVEFSKGMQRRIGLAQCLINDPELIILDEPTTGMDPLGTAEIKELIADLKRKGKTILLCSHLLADVEEVCDEIDILYGGKSMVSGPLASLMQKDNMTQITARMDTATVNAVKSVILNAIPDQDINVSPPVERLESFFLRIISEAQTKQLETSGVASSSKAGVDALFQDSHGKDLLDKLIQGDDDDRSFSPQESPSPRDNDETDVDLTMLRHLTEEEVRDASLPPSEDQTTHSTEKKPPHKDVLKQLLDGEEEDL